MDTRGLFSKAHIAKLTSHESTSKESNSHWWLCLLVGMEGFTSETQQPLKAAFTTTLTDERLAFYH